MTDSVLDFAKDPDWSVKFENKRMNIKRIILLFGLIVLWVQWKVKAVEKFDHLKRVE